MTRTSVTPLIRAAKRTDLRALHDAIHAGADINGTDSQGWTPLFHAAHKGWTEGVRVIIEAGADVNHGSEAGFTAFFSAVISGHLEVVQVLLEAGAEVRDVQGVRLAKCAQGNNRQQIVAALEETTPRRKLDATNP
jgi:ankyrin repeat protein